MFPAVDEPARRLYNKISMEKRLHELIGEAFPDLALRDAESISPAVLAYIGDTVYDLYVRTALIHASAAGNHGLHMMATARVNAAAQAAAWRAAEPWLTEKERDVFRRGRNAHSGVVPRHASPADYRAATGFEALIGYLYLTGDDERLTALIRRCLEAYEGEKEDG